MIQTEEMLRRIFVLLVVVAIVYVPMVVAAAADGVHVATDQSPTSKSWSSRAWDIYQRYYRLIDPENTPDQEDKTRAHASRSSDGYWNRFLGLIEDDRHVYLRYDVSSSSSITPDGIICDSPFGLDDRERMASCFGHQSVVMAAYDSDVQFATSILSTLEALGGDNLTLFGDNTSQTVIFEFTVHQQYEQEEAVIIDSDSLPDAEMNSTSSNNEADTAAALATMLKCIGTSSDDVLGFISSSLAEPDSLQEDALDDLCSVCMGQIEGIVTNATYGLAETYAGGGSNAFLQLYCSDTSTVEPKSTLLLTAGGGHDGQAGPRDIFGSGGGAGIQVQVEPPEESAFAFDTFSACNGGGCGLGAHMAGENPEEDSVVLQDSYCDLNAFVAGLELAKAEIQACILDPERDLMITSGGGSDGRIGSTVDHKIHLEYSTGFRFEKSPNVEGSS